VKYERNMTGEPRKKHFQSYIDICPLLKNIDLDYISTFARKGLRLMDGFFGQGQSTVENFCESSDAIEGGLCPGIKYRCVYPGNATSN
jgi:hypothetical protein